MKPELTIGIGTCGRTRLLRRCINSLRKYTHIPFKLIVVDNTKAFYSKYIPPRIPSCEYIEIIDKKIGCTETNNIILDRCETDYLMHIDDDVYVRDDFTVDKLFMSLKKLEKEYDRVAVGASWYDTYYKSFRHGSMKYIIGYNNEKKYIKKVPIDFKFIQSLNLELVETDELLHSFIIRKDLLLSDNIKWDNNFKWKGDRLDFFLQLKNKRWKLYQRIPNPMIHDPQPLKYGSLSYEFNGDEAIEYFYKKWNIHPIVGWNKFQDKPR